MDMCKVSREEEECLFKRPPNLEASMLAIFLIPSKTGAEQDVGELLKCLISDQNLLFLFLENECVNFSCKRNLCLHFRWRIAYFYTYF